MIWNYRNTILHLRLPNIFHNLDYYLVKKGMIKFIGISTRHKKLLTTMTIKDYPEIVYKYRNWTSEYNKNVLLKNQLYLSSPKDFNDPFDFRIPDNWNLLDSPDKVVQYVDGVIERQRDSIIAKGLDLDLERKRMVMKVSDTTTFQKEREKLLFVQQDIHFGVLSLSVRWDSILMWSHYSDFHKGYCIGIYEEKLRNSGLFGKGGPVSYYAKFPELNPLDEDKLKKSFIQTHSKADNWCYEKEYRLEKLFYPDPPTQNDRIVTITDDFITDVTIGLCTPIDHKKEIINECKKRNIKVFSTEKVPFEFKVERIEL